MSRLLIWWIEQNAKVTTIIAFSLFCQLLVQWEENAPKFIIGKKIHDFSVLIILIKDSAERYTKVSVVLVLIWLSTLQLYAPKCT